MEHSEEDIRASVKGIMFKNLEAGYSKYLDSSYLYNKPSHRRYPFQWWWDTCFHAYIWCALGEYEIAKRNMTSLFTMQEENGFVGHVIYWESLIPNNPLLVIEAKPNLAQIRPHMSSMIQPSLVAQVVERIYGKTEDHTFLEKMVPKMKRYHEWTFANRDVHGDELLSIISPMETGMDWKPSYDTLLGYTKDGPGTWGLYWRLFSVELRNFFMRYDSQKILRSGHFQAKDVAVNTINALDLHALARLCRILGDTDAERYEQKAQRMTDRINAVTYDEEDEAYYDVCGKENTKLKVLTPTIFFPMVLPGTPVSRAKRILARHLRDGEQFALPYPIPSVAKNEPQFVPGRQRVGMQEFLWRGPTWVFHNWFIYKCLKAKGCEDEAKLMRASIIKLINKSGFREYYNPLTGEGYGAQDFTWSGLVLDME